MRVENSRKEIFVQIYAKVLLQVTFQGNYEWFIESAPSKCFTISDTNKILKVKTI